MTIKWLHQLTLPKRVKKVIKEGKKIEEEATILYIQKVIREEFGLFLPYDTIKFTVDSQFEALKIVFEEGELRYSIQGIGSFTRQDYREQLYKVKRECKAEGKSFNEVKKQFYEEFKDEISMNRMNVKILKLNLPYTHHGTF